MIAVDENVSEIWYQTGIIPCLKGSFEFAMIGNTLFMQGGEAIVHATRMHLPKASYRVLDVLDIAKFSNHTTYYLSLHKEPVCEGEGIDVISQVKLEEGCYFCMSDQCSEEAFLLGELEIDYEKAQESGRSIIGASYNAFSPQKNEISIRNAKRVKVWECISLAERKEVSGTVMALSKALLHLTQTTKHVELSIPCTTFFTFSQEILQSEYLPSRLFDALQAHCTLLVWIRHDIWEQDVQEVVAKIEALVADPWQCAASYYRLDLDQEEGYFSQLFALLKEMSEKLYLGTARDSLAVHEEVPMQYDIDTFIEDFGDISHEERDEEVLDDDGLSTVLLGESTADSVQVGRGTQSGNDIILGENDKTVSRTHLRVTPYKQGFFIEDLSSMGTYVDGVRIEKNKKKFVTSKNMIILGKKGCSLDLNHAAIRALQKQ